ncbi:serine/threonine protein kinase [Nocardiopsis sp. HNM0947]|uniref:Serine/threonine protein kinase n=1 Tax=Nocardiopsis coralli TaxID=2772213 RepID=A0ABR9P643_9ACTN|nr:serine/threonine-protein kinase [Nocardiopsis coralli]MBE2999282.1 serine/threonine protein kinase [Nocardiopsis coralli]
MIPPSPAPGTDPAPPPLPPGVQPLGAGDPRRVGPFRLVGRLGSGGMGVVYAALDDADRRVAVKTVHRIFASDADFRTRFAREVAMVRRVQAACVPRFVGCGPGAEVPWLATEYVPGPTLTERLRHGPLRGPELTLFALGAAEALAAIHAVGVVHRDLKPGNVILSPTGPKVLDFGIARAADETALTHTGGVVGTPGWIAPEQYRGDDATGFSDVFAWACLVAHAATGREPFGAGTTQSVVTRVLDGRPDLDGVPGSLALIMERALDKDPGRRPRADELMRELAVLVPDEASPAVSPSGAVDVTLVMGQAWAGPGAPRTPDGTVPGVDLWVANAPPRESWVRRHRRGIAVGTGALALTLVASLGIGAWAGDGSGSVPLVPGSDPSVEDGEPFAADGGGSGGADGSGAADGDGDASDGGGGSEEDADADRVEHDVADAPAEYQDLFEDGEVTLVPDPDEPLAAVRRIEPADGDGEGLDVLRIVQTEEPSESLFWLDFEYLLDFGALEVRESDFVWAEQPDPSAADGSEMEVERLSSGGMAVLSPDNPTRSDFGFMAPVDREDEPFHYLPRSVSGPEDRLAHDHDLPDLHGH